MNAHIKVKYIDLINANEVHTRLLYYTSVALDDFQQTRHFIVHEQIFSPSYGVLRIRGPLRNHSFHP